jgi:enamine deaminase RidA (YjgF/YER057c/UK114 family)
MDAYAIKGISQEQVKYLHASTHLNPTHEYGVTFERGTMVDYGDRRHIFISGTASIDNKGEIVHLTNIEKQIERTIENIEVLLAEADAVINDISKMIVYLRDTADYQIVSDYLDKYYKELPKVIVWAPVCRPGWLIEIECIAIKEIEANQFEKF